MIGIRSAATGRQREDRSRCGPAVGVVADSDPDAEAEETNVKLATVLDAVVPGASVQLR